MLCKVTGLPDICLVGLPRNPTPSAEVQGPVVATTTDPLPAFGELTVTLATAPEGCEDAAGLVVPGETAAINGKGFTPFEDITLSLVIDNQRLSLGTVNADIDGNLDATVPISSTIPVGNVATIEALAAGHDGVGLLLFDLVRIEHAIDIDGDGDGIPDGCDNCLRDANPEQGGPRFERHRRCLRHRLAYP